MSSSQSAALNQRSFPNQPRRQSKITVEYHRPSRESIQEYSALLADANLHAAEAAKYSPYVPSRAAPPPPTNTSSFRAKTPTTDSPSSPSPTPHRVRNSLQKPPPRPRRHSPPASSPSPRIVERDPFAANAKPNDDPLQHSFNLSHKSNGMAATGTSPPPRPSRNNTANLNDIFPSQSQLAQRRLSQPAPSSQMNENGHFYADPNESMPSIPSAEFTAGATSTTAVGHSSGSRSRSGTTTTKSKKGVLSFMSEVFNKSSQRPEISTPYDPVHLTHVGFNSSTGEFTGLPKEWQQLLQESGISRSEQEKNPQAVMEIVKFYQEGQGDPWDKLGNVGGLAVDTAYTKLEDFSNPVSPRSTPSGHYNHKLTTYSTAFASAPAQKAAINHIGAFHRLL